MNSRLLGYASIFTAAFFWGSSGTAAKLLFQHGIAPMLVVQSRVIIAAVLMTVFLSVKNGRLLSIRRSDLMDFVLLGVIGVAGSNYSYYMAIQLTGVGIAILMQYTASAFVAVYMLIGRKERISGVKTLAIVLSLGGSAVMLGILQPGMEITALGIFLGLLSALCFAFFNVYTRIASKQYSIWTAVTWTLICAGVFWIGLDLLTGFNVAQITPTRLGVLTVFSFSSVIVPYYFYFTGLKYLRPSTAIIVSTLEPVVAIVTSFVFLGETLGVPQIGGGILIILAVILLEVFRE